MTVDFWQQRGVVLAQAHRLQQFEIADWLVQGIEQFGATATYDCAEGVFPQYARATFQSWATVAKHFPSSMRIESDFLTFAHYQVAQGAERDSFRPERDESQLQVAKELVWLRQADERRLSVSALRDTIARNYELRQEQYFNEHPENKPFEPEPEPIKTKPTRKDAYGAELKEFNTPWLDKRQRWSLDELARVRRVRPEQLLARVLQDFLDAHSDEIGDAKAAAAKRESEHEAQVAAADAVARVAREDTEKWRREHVSLSPYEQDKVRYGRQQKAEVVS